MPRTGRSNSTSPSPPAEPYPRLSAQPETVLAVEQERAFARSYLPLLAAIADRHREDIDPYLAQLPQTWAYPDRVVALLVRGLRKDLRQYYNRKGGDIASLFDPGQLENLDKHLSEQLHEFLRRLWTLPPHLRRALAPPPPEPRTRRHQSPQRPRPATPDMPHFKVLEAGSSPKVVPLEEAAHTFRANGQRQAASLLVTVFTYQDEFLREGVARLRPMTLELVADKCGLHQSTVSRIVTKVVVDTPHGVHPLKWFFSAGLHTYTGEKASGRSVAQRIKEIVEEAAVQGEHLDDLDLVRLLRHHGMRVARRTVAKYRAALGIRSARQRRTISRRDDPHLS